eukprot:COSAG01_NODE_2517_length_7524_cov_19.201616_10_plen_94_part_01
MAGLDPPVTAAVPRSPLRIRRLCPPAPRMFGVCSDLVVSSSCHDVPSPPLVVALLLLLSYRTPPPNHDCENMDMPAVVTPSVNVTDMACVGHVV